MDGRGWREVGHGVLMGCDQQGSLPEPQLVIICINDLDQRTDRGACDPRQHLCSDLLFVTVEN